jgi:hypothetical protein
MPENGKSEGSTLFDSDREADSIDFESEADNLKSAEELQNQWFKPKEGKQKVKFLGNGHKETSEYEGETRDVAIFPVEIDGEEKKWSVTVGQTENSLYGQIVTVAGKNGHNLDGVEVTLIRKGTGSDTDYTIMEAVE